MDRRVFLKASIPAIGGATMIAHLAKPFRAASATKSRSALPDEGSLPDFGGATAWLNSAALSGKSLRGKVVLVNFWTYSCINSLRPLPYVKGWAAKYAAKYNEAGLAVIGVHTPEFGFEKERANVEMALRDLKVTYPIPMDNDYTIWRAFNNQYWPAFYFVDGKGRIRYHHFGEGEYDKCERVIQELLKENGATHLEESTLAASADGIEAPPSHDEQSPETYVGYRQAERFASPERLARDSQKTYMAPARISLNQWGLSGSWTDGSESALLQSAPGKIMFRFHSRDLHLVTGSKGVTGSKSGEPVRFRVTLDGAPPGDDHGVDSASDGSGQVREPRLYQLIRQQRRVEDRTCEIEFLDPGVHVFSFTFG
jgi:thiol-disulfide isomerase/thioredoxin